LSGSAEDIGLPESVVAHAATAVATRTSKAVRREAFNGLLDIVISPREKKMQVGKSLVSSSKDEHPSGWKRHVRFVALVGRPLKT
jgi:hypothetical protein